MTKCVILQFLDRHFGVLTTEKIMNLLTYVIKNIIKKSIGGPTPEITKMG